MITAQCNATQEMRRSARANEHNLRGAGLQQIERQAAQSGAKRCTQKANEQSDSQTCAHDILYLHFICTVLFRFSIR